MSDVKTVIERVYAAFNGRDIDSALSVMTDDVSWPKASEGGNVVGKEAIRAYWLRQWSEFSPTVVPMDIVETASGDYSVSVHQVVKDLEGRSLFDGEVQHVYALRGNLIASMTLGEDLGPHSTPSEAFVRRTK